MASSNEEFILTIYPRGMRFAFKGTFNSPAKKQKQNLNNYIIMVKQ